MMCKVALFIHTLWYGKDNQFDDFPERFDIRMDFKPGDSLLATKPDFPDKAEFKNAIVNTGTVRRYFFLPVTEWAW